MRHFYLKYFLYLCLAVNFITGNSNETFLKPEAHESSLRDKVDSHEPRAFILKDMKKRKWICVEVNGVFHETINHAAKAIKCDPKTIKRRCLSDNFLNYKIVPYITTCIEKRCTKCGETKPLKKFCVQTDTRDGLKSECKQCSSEYNKEWLKDNHEYKKECDRVYRKTHKKEKNAYFRKYEMERRATDVAFNLNKTMRQGTTRSLKNKKGGKSWKSLVPYTLGELMAHLESKFTEGMTWDNYGFGDDKWNLDHVIALCHFNITSAECQEFKNCWSLDNLQPLWQVRNFEKGDRPMEPKYLIKPF